MTSLSELEIVDLDQLISWEDDLLCEVGDGNPATHICYFIPCNCQTLNICDSHVERIKRWNAALVTGALKRKCGRCKVSINGVEVRPI